MPPVLASNWLTWSSSASLRLAAANTVIVAPGAEDVANNASTVAIAAEEGHTVAYHSFSHPLMRLLSEKAARADIEHGFQAVDQAVYGSAGDKPRTPFFRFPGFADTPALDAWLAARDIAVFGTDLWAADWWPMTPQAEAAAMLARLEKDKRGIILFHDIRAQGARLSCGASRAGPRPCRDARSLTRLVERDGACHRGNPRARPLGSQLRVRAFPNASRAMSSNAALEPGGEAFQAFAHALRRARE